MPDNATEMGSIIRFHRKRAGLTQLELANTADIGKSAVFDIEKGKTSVRLDTLLKICGALNLSLELNGPLMAAWRESRRVTEKIDAR